MISASQHGHSHADSNMLDQTWQDCQKFRSMSIRRTGDGGLQDFLGVAGVILWNEGEGLDSLEQSFDVRAQYFVLRDKVEAGDRRSSSIGTVSSGKSSQGQ